jgi:PAS domain S-box-containing protein
LETSERSLQKISEIWSNLFTGYDGGGVLCHHKTPEPHMARQVAPRNETGVEKQGKAKASHALESDDALLLLMESLPGAVMAIGADGRIRLINSVAETMFGYHRHEMIGQSIAMLIPERFRAPHAQHVPDFFRRPGMRPMAAGLELFALRKDGSEFPVDIGLSYFETSAGLFGLGFISDVTQQRESNAMLLQNRMELQALTARLLGVQEADNKELSRELHDGFSQKLAALGMEVSTLLRPSAKVDLALKKRVHELSERINVLAGDVHAMSRRLHPAILTELGLEAAMREECTGFSVQQEIAVDFESARIPRSLPEDVSLCLYRVAQESLRNVAKHARAANVKVLLAGNNGGITLRIQDSGEGFRVRAAKGKGGLGLISMEERARLVSGTYTVRSEPGKGTTVDLFVPVETISK